MEYNVTPIFDEDLLHEEVKRLNYKLVAYGRFYLKSNLKYKPEYCTSIYNLSGSEDDIGVKPAIIFYYKLFNSNITKLSEDEITEVLSGGELSWSEWDNLKVKRKELIYKNGILKNKRYSLQSIEKIIIDDSVEIIPDDAFRDCVNLKSVIFNNKLKYIGVCAFWYCESLKTIKLPDSLKMIDWFAFGHTGLTDITIPVNAHIGDEAFCHCDSLESVTFSKNSTVPISGFVDCKNLKYVNIPEGPTEVLGNSFVGCKSLKDIKLPNSTEIIYNYAICDCDFTEFKLPNNIKSICLYAFNRCNNLESIIIPKSVTYLVNPFTRCSSLRSVEVEKGNPKYYSINNCVIDRETKELVLGCNGCSVPDDGSVTSIGDCAFCGLNFKSFKINKYIKEIGHEAFYDCKNLKHIEVPESVTKMGGAFFGCESLESAVINANITKLDTNTFRECYSLKTVVLPKTLKIIKDWAFEECINLESIILPDGLETIDGAAFRHCDSLKQITIPKSVTYIDKQAFLSVPIKKNNTVIICEKDSQAYRFAKKHNFNIKLINN